MSERAREVVGGLVITSIIAALIGGFGYGVRSEYVAEISDHSYENLERWVGDFPLLKSMVYSSMDDGEISYWEYGYIEREYKIMRAEREKIEFVATKGRILEKVRK